MFLIGCSFGYPQSLSYGRGYYTLGRKIQWWGNVKRLSTSFHSYLQINICYQRIILWDLLLYPNITLKVTFSVFNYELLSQKVRAHLLPQFLTQHNVNFFIVKCLFSFFKISEEASWIYEDNTLVKSQIYFCPIKIISQRFLNSYI